MESRFVAAAAVNFVAFVDCQIGLAPSGLQDFVSFFCTEYAGAGSKEFDTSKRVASPD